MLQKFCAVGWLVRWSLTSLFSAEILCVRLSITFHGLCKNSSAHRQTAFTAALPVITRHKWTTSRQTKATVHPAAKKRGHATTDECLCGKQQTMLDIV